MNYCVDIHVGCCDYPTIEITNITYYCKSTIAQLATLIKNYCGMDVKLHFEHVIVVND